MIPSIILVSSLERVVPLELLLLSPLSPGSFGGSFRERSLGFDARAGRVWLRSATASKLAICVIILCLTLISFFSSFAHQTARDHSSLCISQFLQLS